MSVDFNLEVTGNTPLLERPVEIRFFDNRIKKPVKFLADWKREDPKSSFQVLSEIMTKEQELDGAAMIEFQEEQVRERLINIREFPTKEGKKVSAGEGHEYSLSSMLDKLMPIRAYQSGLYKSMVTSLSERELFEDKRKN